jgi:hypothetical protein
MARTWLFCVATFSTFFCTAVNAYTLQVGYPLWRSIGGAEFGAVHREYLQRLNWVITVPHIVMFFSTAGLVIWRPAFMAAANAWGVAALAWVVVGVSAFIAGPVHDRFSRQASIDERGMRWLIAISVGRTLMMLAASVLLFMSMLEGLRK